MGGGSKRKALKRLIKSPSSASGTDSGAASPAPLPPPIDDNYYDQFDLETSPGPSSPVDSKSPSVMSAPIKSPPPKEAAAEPPAVGGMYAGAGEKRGKKSSKQRFAERQARKKQTLLESAPPNDPAWNAQLEKERQDEIRIISDACEVLGREIFEIQPDGHCMFAAVADQLGQLALLPPAQANNPYHARRVAAKYMREHQDDFLPFLASVDGEDMPGATDDGLMTETQFGEYCHRVENTAEWGGEPEIQALCRAFDVPIHVIQAGPPTVVSHGGEGDAFGGATTPLDSKAAGDRVIRISYHRRMYGLGEHYNSLRVPQ